MDNKNVKIRQYQQDKRQMANQWENEFDKKHKETQEKYDNDESTFGKVAKTSSKVIHGVGKVLSFIIKNS